MRKNEISDLTDSKERNLGMEIGSLVRVIRAPFFGKIGKVVDLPSDLKRMESETLVRVAKIKVDNENIVVPRSNLEMLQTD